jgi:hypothetical protein
MEFGAVGLALFQLGPEFADAVDHEGEHQTDRGHGEYEGGKAQS